MKNWTGRNLGLILLLFLVVIVGTAGVTWVFVAWWRVRQAVALSEGTIPLPHQQGAADRVLLDVQLARIRASGDPLTTAEMAAFHRVPEGTPDLTPRYLLLLETFQTPTYEAEIEGIPIVGDWEAALVPLDQPDDQRDALRAFLAKHADTIKALEEFGQEAGSVRYPIEFQDGKEALLPHWSAVHDAARALRLRYLVLMQAGEFDSARSSLHARLRLAGTLSREPSFVSQLVWLAAAGDAIRDLSNFVSTVPQTKDELLRWQEVLSSLDFQQGLVDALIGERAMFWHTMHHDLNSQGEYFGNDIGKPLFTGNGPSGILRMRDCAAGLGIFNDDLDVARQGFPAITNETGRWEARIEQLRQQQLRTKQPDYMGTMYYTPDFDYVSRHYVHQTVQRNIVLAQIALTRYHTETTRLPMALKELVPQYLQGPLTDAWDGAPLRYLPKESAPVLYSVGQDRIDDGGEGEFTSEGTPDVVLRVTFPAVSP